jgi:hypothetical protein
VAWVALRNRGCGCAAWGRFYETVSAQIYPRNLKSVNYKLGNILLYGFSSY